MRIALAAALALASAAAPAQDDEINIFVAAEEAVSDATAESVLATVSDERSRLLVRLEANAPDQTPGAINTPASELAGRMIANAMRRVVILEPNGQSTIVAIAPQSEPDGSGRQLVLLNLSAWIANGRGLGLDDLETFAVLPDEEIRQPGGSPFELNGVRYYGAVEDGNLVFHRAP
jgi:hypothetical protein